MYVLLNGSEKIQLVQEYHGSQHNNTRQQEISVVKGIQYIFEISTPSPPPPPPPQEEPLPIWKVLIQKYLPLALIIKVINRNLQPKYPELSIFKLCIIDSKVIVNDFVY